MTPCRFQLPPPADGASQSVTTCPPETSTVFNLLSAKNPIDWLSADQNGASVPSVPGRGRAVEESNGRTHTMVVPCASTATNSSVRPSGEICGAPLCGPTK